MTYVDEQCDGNTPTFLTYGISTADNSFPLHDPENKEIMETFVKMGTSKSMTKKIESGVVDLRGDIPTFFYVEPGVDRGEEVMQHMKNVFLRQRMFKEESSWCS